MVRFQLCFALVLWSILSAPALIMRAFPSPPPEPPAIILWVPCASALAGINCGPNVFIVAGRSR